MKLKRIDTPGIAHYAWLLADGPHALLVDPRRDVEEYLQAADEMGVQIETIVETHRQEDFEMGAAWLAERTGAKIANGPHETFGHGDLRLDDGDTFSCGGLSVRALHTPGHTPESMCYAVYADGSSDEAWCVFTGDTLFFGTTGRTDLPDADRSVENAGRLYDSVHGKLAGLGDTCLVLPAHGPGSVCGSGMADRPFSTLGQEKRENHVFTLQREAFAKDKGGEQLPRPPFFRHMEEVNLRGGRPPVLHPGNVARLGVEALAESLEEGLVFDTREPEAFAGGHVAGSHNIWLGGLPVFGGWVADAESAIRLVTDRDEDVAQAVLHLSRIGLDGVEGALAGGFGAWRKSGRPIEGSGTITPRELADDRERFQVLDVREIGEFEAGHIPGARRVYVGELPEELEGLDLDRSRPVVVNCTVGHRAGVAASMLLRAGFEDVRNLLGGFRAWEALDLEVESGDGG